MAYNTVQKALAKALAEKYKYQENLVGKVFAYAYINKFTKKITIKEVVFKVENYLHLTGLDYKKVQYKKRVLGINTPTNADEFYNRLGNDNSLINDVDFINEATPQKTQLTFRHTQDKLDNLSQIVNIAKKAEYIGEYNDPNKYDLIINRNKETLAFIKDGDVYVPMSSRHGDVNKFINGNSKCPVLAIFSKSEGQKYYQIDYLNATVRYGKTHFERSLAERLSLSSFENPNVKFNISKLEELKRIFLLSEEKYISLDLSEIAELRRDAFSSDEAYNAYENKCKDFFGRMNTEHKRNYAISALSKQLEGIEQSASSSEDKNLEDIADLMNSELSEIKNLNKAYGGTSNVHIVKNKPLQLQYYGFGEGVIPLGKKEGNSDRENENMPSSFIDKILSDFREKIDGFKNTLRKLFDFSRSKAKVETKPETNADVIQKPAETTEETAENKEELQKNIPSGLLNLIEARKEYLSKKIEKSEYHKALADFMLSLKSESEINEAVDMLNEISGALTAAEKNCVKNEIFNLQHYSREKFHPENKSFLEELRDASADKSAKQHDDAAEKVYSPDRSNHDR